MTAPALPLRLIGRDGVARSCLVGLDVADGTGPLAARRALERTLAESGGCVEDGPAEPLPGDHLARTLALGGFYMALSTATAYRIEPAHLFCAALAHRLTLSEARAEALQLAVHEALANGIIHGNLEMTSQGRQSLDAFADYCRTIDGRLAEPRLAGRWIEVFATWDDAQVMITVADGGQGYDPATVNDADCAGKSGRGLQLIHSLAQVVERSDGGRSITMRFDR